MLPAMGSGVEFHVRGHKASVMLLYASDFEAMKLNK